MGRADESSSGGMKEGESEVWQRGVETATSQVLPSSFYGLQVKS